MTSIWVLVSVLIVYLPVLIIWLVLDHVRHRRARTASLHIGDRLHLWGDIVEVRRIDWDGGGAILSVRRIEDTRRASVGLRSDTPWLDIKTAKPRA